MTHTFIKLLPVLLLVTARAMAEPIADIEAGLASDDNVNNGLSRDEKKSDVQEYFNMTFGEAMSVGDDGSIALTGNIEAHHFNHYEGLDNVAPGLTLGYKTKLGLGPAPWVRIAGSASRLEYKDDVRSGWLYHADASIDKQLTRQWYLTAALRFEKRTADHDRPYESDVSGAVFDQIGRSIGGNVNYWYDNVTAFSFGYLWRSGDVAASVREADDLEYNVKAITEDEVFGSEFYAYKIHAITQLLSFSVNREVSEHGMLKVKFERRIAHGDDDLNYYNSMVSASYQHHF